MRVDTLWRASSDLQVRYHYDRSDIRDTPHFIDAVDPQRSPDIPDHGSPFEPDVRPNDITADGHGLTVSWDLTDTLNLKSITTYRELDSETDRNFLTDVMVPQRPLTGGTNITEQNQLSQELQLTGEALDARLQYVAGLYYFEESADRADDVTPINAPEHSATVDIAYRFPATAAGVVTANVGYTWQDDMNTSTSDPDLIIDAYGLLNARVTLAEIPVVSRGDLRVSLWGKNLTNEEYYIALFNVLVPAAYYGEPRSYGFDLTYGF